jgi:DNA-binding NtrC family response regulator
VLLATTEPAPPPLLEAFAKEGLGVAVVDSRQAFEAALAERMVVVALVDLAFPGASLDIFRAALAERAPRVPLVLIADSGSIGAAIEAVKGGARDYVMKPLVVEDVLFVVQGARTSADAAPAQAPWAASEAGAPRTLVGDSGPMRAVLALVARAAPSQATVLIGGETGTGKELVARRIHELSPRSAGPFVKVQCGALPEALLESELYGYEKGAFTGATARKPGRVELAQGGTLFLDEIGDITPGTQVKLLRVLQDREYERLGGTETRRADVRFVTATHRDLPAMVAKGEFREDLFYRLNVVRIVLPPLRERLEDLPGLARHFAALACRANGLNPVAITESALEELRKERWPGNIRQLQNLIERLVVLSDSDALTAADVRRELAEHPASEAPPAAEAPREMSAIDLKGAVSKAEKRQIEKALLKSKGNRDLAARLLGISLRTLYYKLRVYGLE